MDDWDIDLSTIITIGKLAFKLGYKIAGAERANEVLQEMAKRIQKVQKADNLKDTLECLNGFDRLCSRCNPRKKAQKALYGYLRAKGLHIIALCKWALLDGVPSKKDMESISNAFSNALYACYTVSEINITVLTDDADFIYDIKDAVDEERNSINDTISSWSKYCEYIDRQQHPWKYRLKWIIPTLVVLILLAAIGFGIYFFCIKDSHQNEEETLEHQYDRKEDTLDYPISYHDECLSEPDTTCVAVELVEFAFPDDCLIDSVSCESAELVEAVFPEESEEISEAMVEESVDEDYVIYEDDKVYNGWNVQQPPVFPGGEAAMYKWLKDNIYYPESAAKEGIEGRVVVEFVVTKIGEIENARVVRSRHPALDTEAIRVVNAMPQWEPGKNNGIPLNVKLIIPVTFKFNNN